MSCPCCLFRSVGSLAADTTHTRSPLTYKKGVRPASGRVEESPFVSRVQLKTGQISFFFLRMRRPTSCKGLLGVSTFFKNLFLFYLILFLFCLFSFSFYSLQICMFYVYFTTISGFGLNNSGKLQV